MDVSFRYYTQNDWNAPSNILTNKCPSPKVTLTNLASSIADCVDKPAFTSISTNNHSTNGGSETNFTVQNIPVYLQLTLMTEFPDNPDPDQVYQHWTVTQRLRADDPIVASSPAGTGKNLKIFLGLKRRLQKHIR